MLIFNFIDMKMENKTGTYIYNTVCMCVCVFVRCIEYDLHEKNFLEDSFTIGLRY